MLMSPELSQIADILKRVKPEQPSTKEPLPMGIVADFRDWDSRMEQWVKDCESVSVSCHTVFGRVTGGMEVVEGLRERDPATDTLPGTRIQTIEISAIPIGGSADRFHGRPSDQRGLQTATRWRNLGHVFPRSIHSRLDC